MSPTTVRRVSDRDAARGARYFLLRWMAVFLVILTVASAVWLLGQDVGWDSRLREARELADSATEYGNFQLARDYYLRALANQPYDWRSHFALARLENVRLNNREAALRHYLYALAYSPDQSITREAREEIEILRMIRRGDLENPLDALEDMFLAVEEGADRHFLARLAPGLREAADSYWRAWSRRGRGTLNYCRIRGGNDGFFDANIELFFVDGTAMSMHLACAKGSIWRLDLSFP